MKTLPIFLLVALIMLLTGCANADPGVPRIGSEEAKAKARIVASTQDYIDKCNNLLYAGYKEAQACKTVAGQNDAILSALDKASAVIPSKFADKKAVGTYQHVLLQARDWFEVRPSWKTNVEYGALGVVAGTVDWLGGFGLATTGVAAAATADMESRWKRYEQMETAIEEWREFCGKEGYMPGNI